MRKLAYIFTLLCCLFLLVEGERERDVVLPVTPIEELTQGNGTRSEWLCERHYNSDLELPRLFTESSSVTVTTLCLCGARLFVPTHYMAGRLAPTFHFLPRYCSVPMSGAVTRAADFYVYRMRRLLI